MTDATPAQRVRRALEHAEHGPLKHLSQNFLVDPNILRKIVAAAEVAAGDQVLEVGPGPGVLTAELLASGAHVTAIELDQGFADYLRAEFAGERLRLVQGDVLQVDLGGILGSHTDWLLVSNLPYAISTPVLELIGRLRQHIRRAAVMLQREVAVRVCASHGGRDRGPLSVFVQRWFVPRVVFAVRPSAFRPPPAVGSALLRLDRLDDVGPRAPDAAFEQVVRAAFGQRRKMLRRALASGPFGVPSSVADELIAAAGLSGEERAEQLSGAAVELMAVRLAQLWGTNR